MLTDTDQRSGNDQERRRRSRRAGAAVRAAGLAAVAAAALLAAAPAGAQVPSDGTVFVHSAKSGKFSGGKLTLHGVGRHVTWSHHSGRSGVIAVKKMHRRVFSPKTPPAIGTLHVAGHRGGDELTFKLSRPRHNHARRTVSYKAKPLGNGRFPSRAALAAAAARSFGTASLSIQDPPQPSLTVSQDTYGCTDGASGTCWGILNGSNLQPWGEVDVFGPQKPGNTGQGKDWDITVAPNGLAGGGPVYLNFLCNVPYHIVHTEAQVDGSKAGGPSFTVQAPSSCG